MLKLPFASGDDNLAPAKPLAKAMEDREREAKNFEAGSDWFKKTYKQLSQESETIWRSQNLLWQMLFLMIEGKQLLRQSTHNNTWRAIPLPQKTDQPVYSINLLGFYTDALRAKMTQSQTDIVWRAANDSDEALGAAKAATKLHQYYSRILYTNDFRQTEALMSLCGKYARYYYYSMDAKRLARVPQTETQQLAFGGGAWMCADCGSGGELSELQATPDGVPACPYCGSERVQTEEAPTTEVEAHVGWQEKNIGDIVVECVPPFELKHDLTTNPQDSPYLIRRRRVRLALLQSQYPEILIRPQRTEQPGLTAEEAMKNSTWGSPNSFTLKSGMIDGEDTVDFIQVWLDPQMYSTIKLSAPFQTLNGEEIEAGTFLIDLFPRGMYMAWIEGIDGCVELRNEHHKDFFVGQVYRKRAISSLGSGIEDMVEIQRQFNLTLSMMFVQLRTAAMPAMLYDERALPNGTSSYLGSLANIPVNTAAVDGMRLSDAVLPLPSQPPSPQHFNYAEKLNTLFQMTSRVVDFSEGLGANNETATGAEILQATSNGLHAPMLSLKAEVDRIGAELIMNLYRTYTDGETYIHLSGKRGELQGEWLKAADLSTDLYAEIVPESYLPQTNLERRQRMRGFLTDIGGFPNLPPLMAQAPGLIETMAELYDVDLGMEDMTNVVEIAKLRIRQLMTNAPVVEQFMAGMPPTQETMDPVTGEIITVPVDPVAEAGQMLLQGLNPPIELEEMGHQTSIRYLRDWLTTDEGIKAGPIVRSGVKAMIYAHIEGVMAEAQMMGAVAMMGQPPPPEGEGEEEGEEEGKSPKQEPKTEEGKKKKERAKSVSPRDDKQQSNKDGNPRPAPHSRRPQERKK